MLRVGLAVPLYNEEDCCQRVVEQLLAAFAGLRLSLALVNNGSTDQTPQIVNRLAVQHTEVHALHLSENAGYGGGILAGVNSLDTPVVGWTWGDGQIDARVARAAFDKLRTEQCDLVKTRRVERHDGLQRKLVSAAYSRVMRHGFGLPWTDVNGCPKLMTRATWERLQVRSLDWFLDPEVLLKAHEMGLNVGEVDAVMQARDGGVSKVDLSTVREFAERLRAWKGGWRPT